MEIDKDIWDNMCEIEYFVDKDHKELQEINNQIKKLQEKIVPLRLKLNEKIEKLYRREPTIDELTAKRNKLNRQISTLKKATLIN